jgi:hypothetical protein
MKILRITGIFLAVLFLNINVKSQVTIRLNAGLSLCRMNTDPDADIKTNYGIPVGITAELSAGKYLKFETGLVRSPKGFRSGTFEESTDGTIEKRLRFKPVYMEVPLAAKFSFQAGDLRIFAKTGVYLGAGSGGTIKTIQYLNDVKTGVAISQISFGPLGTDNLRRLDYGLVLATGCDIKSLQFELFYEPGLRDVSPDNMEQTFLKNRIIGISIAYTLLSY